MLILRRCDALQLEGENQAGVERILIYTFCSPYKLNIYIISFIGWV